MTGDQVELAGVEEHGDTAKRDERGLGEDREDREAARLLQAKSDQLSRSVAASVAGPTGAETVTRLRPARLDPSAFAQAIANQGQKPAPQQVKEGTWDDNYLIVSGYWGPDRTFRSDQIPGQLRAKL